jgi:adenylate cyclase
VRLLPRPLRALGERASSLLERVPVRRVDTALAALVTLAGLAAFAFTGIGQHGWAGFSFLQNVELRSLDARFELRGAREHDERIVIVGLDENTLHKVGSFPIGRNYYAQLIDRLNAGGARVIAFDFAFPTPEKNSAVEALQQLEKEVAGMAPAAVLARIREIQRSSDNDVIFAEALQRAGNVVLGHLFLSPEFAQSFDPKAAEEYFKVLWGRPFPQMRKVTSGGRDFDFNQAWIEAKGFTALGVEANIVLLAEAARSYGFFDIQPDNDGTVRRALLLVRYRDLDFYPSLALQTVREYENIKDQSIAGYMSETGLERIEFGPYKLWPARDATMLINYAGPYQTYPHYSFGDVMDGTVPAGTFRDKIVLVGPTAVGIGDMRNTPYHGAGRSYMGVEVHANIVDNLLNSNVRGRGFLSRGSSEEMADIFFILLFGAGLGFWFGRTRPLIATASALGALLLFALIVYLAFTQWGMWLSFVIPAGVLLANYAAITSFRMIFEEREKRRIRRSFGQYVSPGVIALIEKDPKRYFRPGGENKELTVMFSDIRSFTSISEGMTPDELVFLLNEYLGEMTDIIFHRWGTLDKYIGDAIMAFWGSPFPQDDHAVRACSAALDMGARLDELNLKWEVEGRKHKPLAIGIGINTGNVNVGNMGSAKRLAWTVMGDHVNLASRLEGLTKEYQVRIVLGEGTWRQVKDEFVGRELDRIRVKGKQQPVAIYELMAYARDAQSYRDLLQRFHDALSSYRRQEWSEAAQRFEALLSRSPDDGPSHVLLKRCHEFMKESPAPGWDGVYVMKSK